MPIGRSHEVERAFYEALASLAREKQGGQSF